MIRSTAFDDPYAPDVPDPRKQQPRAALFSALEAPPQAPSGPAPAVSPAAAPAFPKAPGAGSTTPGQVAPAPQPGAKVGPASGGVVGPATGAPPPPGGGQFNYEAARDAWMSGRYGTDEAGAARWAQEFGIPYQGGDTITLPNGGGMIDIIGNFKAGSTGGARAANWTPAGGNSLGGADGSGNPGGYGAPAGGAAGGGPGGDFNSQVRAMLMQQLGAMGQTPGADDPIIKNQVDAYRREKERSGQNQRAALAERAAQSGLLQGGASSGAFDTNIQGIQEGIGEDVGQFAAGATAKELYNRRDKLTQLMSMALQTGDSEMARALQLQIAQMDNQLRYATLGQQGRQFDASLGENRRQYDDSLGFNMGRAAEDDQRWRLEYGF